MLSCLQILRGVRVKKVVGIGFKDGGKIYWFNPDPFKLKVGSMVVVETVRGLELGKVVKPIQEIEDEKISIIIMVNVCFSM